MVLIRAIVELIPRRSTSWVGRERVTAWLWLGRAFRVKVRYI